MRPPLDAQQVRRSLWVARARGAPVSGKRQRDFEGAGRHDVLDAAQPAKEDLLSAVKVGIRSGACACAWRGARDEAGACPTADPSTPV